MGRGGAGSQGHPYSCQAVTLTCPRAAPGRRERSPWSCGMHPWPAVHSFSGATEARARTVTERKEGT